MIFGEAQLQLHKWHSNEPSLEAADIPMEEGEQRFAKAQLGVKEGETKLLGSLWNKTTDKIAINFPDNKLVEPTKRGVLSSIAKIYDPLAWCLQCL